MWSVEVGASNMTNTSSMESLSKSPGWPVGAITGVPSSVHVSPSPETARPTEPGAPLRPMKYMSQRSSPLRTVGDIDSTCHVSPAVWSGRTDLTLP